MLTRCQWVKLSNPLYVSYHDKEWGVPVYRDKKLFAMLCLEGAQAGLSWETVLNKRIDYYRVFENFDPYRIAKFPDSKLNRILKDPRIIRNRLKVYAVRENARAYVEFVESGGIFRELIWSFVEGEPLINHYESIKALPSRTIHSDAMSLVLSKLGFRFVGSTICYAFMQAVGMVNDHTTDCFRYGELVSSKS